MKVVIGPYKNWIGPYQIADLLMKVGVSEERCYKIGEWLSGPDDNYSLLMKLCLWIESKRKRTIKIRIDEYDTWSMDSNLALIILPMLKQLKETKQGIPALMEAFQYDSNKTQLCFDFYEEDDNLVTEAAEKQWNEILDKMIWSFERIVDKDDDAQFTSGTSDMKSVPCEWDEKGEPTRYTFEKGPNHTLKFDSKAFYAHREKIQEGLNLFGKNYLNLWT